MFNKKIIFTFLTVFLLIVVTDVFLGIIFPVDKNYIKTKINESQINSVQQFDAHPYFGMVFRRGQKLFHEQTNTFKYLNVNNHGFRSKLDYPPQSNFFKIGIFGGSVADAFAVYLEFTNAFKPLEEIIGKKIQIVNLSIPTGKQPQQYFIHSYYEQFIDMGINLDGLNEISAASKKVPPEYPYFDFTDLINIDSALEDFLAYKKQRKMQTAMLRIAQKTFLKSSFLYRLLLKTFDRKLAIAEYSLQRSLMSFNSKKKDFYYKDISDAGMMDHYIAIWKKYLELQQNMANFYNKKHYFFLQPIPQLKGAKILSEQEIEFNQNDNRPPKNIKQIVNAYPRLQKIVEEYKRPNIVDLSFVFSDISESTYIDACCHLNDLGHQLLSKKIIDIISADYNQ